MNVASASGLPDYVLQQAMTSSSDHNQLTLGVAILKQTLNQQEESGAALVRMIQNSSVSQGIGGRIDVSI